MKIKTKKIKKAASGLQDIAVPEQGSYSDVASSASTFASAGSQFGPYGAGAGLLLGAGLGLLNKNKQDKANAAAKYTNQVNKNNRAYSAVDPTSTQASQFSKGTKMIEIEGKKTPEIHTDSNFNVKNLGTTPHSKGGNKVVAEEGDIVFNTQNSLAKYNKIASAISNKDHKTLKAERDKLPEDTGNKKQTGDRSIKKPKTASDSLSAMAKGRIPALTGKQYTNLFNRATNKTPQTSPTNKLYTPKVSGNLGMNVEPGAFNLPSKVNRPTGTIAPASWQKPGYQVPYIHNAGSTTAAATTSPKTSKAKVKQADNSVKLLTPRSTTDSSLPDLTPLKGVQSPDQKLVSGNMKLSPKVVDNTTTDNSITAKTPKVGSSTLNNALQFAGVANNLFQGVKNEPTMQENYINPQLLTYQDRSSSARAQSTAAMNVQNANARNLSGGNAGNLRANMNASTTANSTRQAEINEKEQARADAITNTNIGMQNQAAEVNAARRDNYQQIMAANRAAKEAFIGQAASDIGQYGMAKQEEGYMRSRDDKANATQLAGLKATSTGNFSRTADGDKVFNADGVNGSVYNRFNVPTSTFPQSASTTASKTRRKRFGIFKKGGIV